MKTKKRIGELMTDGGLINELQLNQALADQFQFGGRLGSILVDKCMIREKDFLRVLSGQLGVPAYNFLGKTIPEKVMHLVSRELAWKHMMVPVESRLEGGRLVLTLAMSDPTDALAIEVAEKVSRHQVRPVLATDFAIRMVLMDYYEGQQGRGDLRVKHNSEPEQCSFPVAPATVREPSLPSAWQGPEPVELVEEIEVGDNLLRAGEHAEEHDQLAIEMQAFLQLLVKKGVIEPNEYAQELRGLRSAASQPA